MTKLRVVGGSVIAGDIEISGAKNAVLPIIAATLLAEQPVILDNVPSLDDVNTMSALIKELGVTVILEEKGVLALNAASVSKTEAPYDLVKNMRASILVLGPLLARFGHAEVSFPGGCAIGVRPVDLHLEALRALGAEISVKNGFILATVDGRLKGCDIYFDSVTVTGTENIMMAACLAEGRTVLHSAAIEPEVVDLANFLNQLGASVTGAGTNTITIDGVEALRKPGRHRIIPDRIEAGTYLAAAAITGGSVRLNHVNPEHLSAVLAVLQEAGAEIQMGDDWIALDMGGKRPKAVSFKTEIYPGVPTDMQAQLMAMNVVADGEGVIEEAVFENRLMHVPEMRRLGADLKLVAPHTIRSTGVASLTAAPVKATDLRASAGLVLSALVAEGVTIISRIHHLDRGYADLDEKLRALGVDISRVSDDEEDTSSTSAQG